MHKNLLFLFIVFTSFTLLASQNFIIKKAKKIIVSYKDQCLDAVGQFLRKNPQIVADIGLLLYEYSCVQDQLTTIAATELDGKQHQLSQCPKNRYKTIRDATEKINNSMLELQKNVIKLNKQLNEYSALLQDKQHK